MEELTQVTPDFRGWLANAGPNGLPDPVFPIYRSDPEAITSTLAKLAIGDLQGRVIRGTTVAWGEGDGSVRVVIDPKRLAVVERGVNGLDGRLHWACKAAHHINDRKGGTPTSVSSAIIKVAEEAWRTNPDRASKTGHEKVKQAIRKVAEAIDRVRWDGATRGRHRPPMVQRMGEGVWKIVIEPSKSGPGLTVVPHGAMRQMEIQMRADEESGMIFATTSWIFQSGRGNDWGMAPVHGVEFAPTQSIPEMVEVLATIVRWA